MKVIKISFRIRLKMATPWMNDNDGSTVVEWILNQDKNATGIGIISDCELGKYR